MVIKSTKKNKKIPYHDKVIKKYNTLINSIHPELNNCNPIISGSNAIKLIYVPESTCSDVDIYFETEENFKAAQTLLSNNETFNYETKNAISFNNGKVQLIKKFFLPPQQLILTHDLINVACAISKEGIYTTQKTHYSWYMKELLLQKFQIPEDPSPEEYLIAIDNLINRIKKYLQRYNLSLSNSLKKFLHQQRDLLKTNNEIVFSYRTNEVHIDYYGNPIVEKSFSSKETLININNLLDVNSRPWSFDQENFC